MKARPFVMTLRDHFADRAAGSGNSTFSNSDSAAHPNPEQDEWARQYVDVKYLQPIMDAIDDDGSGHVTIAEVNQFTELLPSSLGWRQATYNV